MGKYLILAAGLAVSVIAHAQHNYADDAQRGYLMGQQIQAMQAYNQCIRAGNTYCAAPPQVYVPPAPVYQTPTQCHQVCNWSGQTRYCNTQCN
jgi:hypothetical protein